MTSPPLPLDLIDALQMRYFDALDGKDMYAWLDTFSEADDTSYVLNTFDNETADLPLALMLDDCRARLEDRVTYIREIWAGTFEDYRTRHFAQRIACTSAGEADTYNLRSNFCVFFTSDADGQSRVLACGEYRDVIRIEAGEARFLSRKALCDTTVLPQYLVYPV
jgi:3-phenylpropionate/cinnamic acid dioxygenase small subunit